MSEEGKVRGLYAARPYGGEGTHNRLKQDGSASRADSSESVLQRRDGGGGNGRVQEAATARLGAVVHGEMDVATQMEVGRLERKGSARDRHPVTGKPAGGASCIDWKPEGSLNPAGRRLPGQKQREATEGGTALLRLSCNRKTTVT